MATLAKKIHILNSAGTEQTVNLYSTTGELSTASGYTHQYVDGVTCYAALVPTDHSRATSGRVLKNGTTYAWGSAAPAPSYAYATYTTAGSGTFTVPAGVTKLRVTCVGGGAGSQLMTIPNYYGCSGTAVTQTTYGDTGCAGGTTTFGSVSASGGQMATSFTGTRSAGTYYSGCDGSGYRGCKYTLDSYTVGKGFYNGSAPRCCNSGAGDDYFIGSAVPLLNYQGTTIFSAGQGGAGDGDGGDDIAFNGSSGYRTVSTISVTPGQVISYTVGAGGRGKRYGSWCSSWCSSGGASADPGRAGGILVEWGSGIE